jgi:hypothetical protein
MSACVSPICIVLACVRVSGGRLLSYDRRLAQLAGGGGPHS